MWTRSWATWNRAQFYKRMPYLEIVIGHNLKRRNFWAIVEGIRLFTSCCLWSGPYITLSGSLVVRGLTRIITNTIFPNIFYFCLSIDPRGPRYTLPLFTTTALEGRIRIEASLIGVTEVGR